MKIENLFDGVNSICLKQLINNFKKEYFKYKDKTLTKEDDMFNVRLLLTLLDSLNKKLYNKDK